MSDWDDWNTALVQARVAASPAEVHGSIVGYLCAGWGGQAHELLAALALESGDAGAEDALHALVDQAAAAVHADLRAGVPVEPLLPAGRVAVRANALVDWCRGFLGGLGLTGVPDQHGHAADTAALLADFARVASLHLTASDRDTAALGDVLAFVRAGVPRVYAAFAPSAQP
ncbi:MAG TPA: UPF0149 family protein [Rhodanobacteraceae bacterium]